MPFDGVVIIKGNQVVHRWSVARATGAFKKLRERHCARNFAETGPLLNVMCPTGAGTTYRGNDMNKIVIMKAVTLGGIFAISLMATAYNTVAGAGKDTASVGNAVTNTADKSK